MKWACEAGIGADYTGPAPVIKLCGKPAKLYPAFFSQAALCEEHKHLARNPHNPSQRSNGNDG